MTLGGDFTAIQDKSDSGYDSPKGVIGGLPPQICIPQTSTSLSMSCPPGFEQASRQVFLPHPSDTPLPSSAHRSTPVPDVFTGASLEDDNRRRHELAMIQLKIEADERRAERERQVERERADREDMRLAALRAHELAMAKIQYASNNSSDREQTLAIRIKLVPAFDATNIHAWFARFEKKASQFNWPEEDFVTLCSSVITGKALEAYDRLLPTCTYNAFKSAVIGAYSPRPEACRLAFRSVNKRSSETHKDTVNRLRDAQAQWLYSESVTDLAAANNLYLLEQFLTSVEPEIRVRIQLGNVKCPEEAARIADDFLLYTKGTTFTQERKPKSSSTRKKSHNRSGYRHNNKSHTHKVSESSRDSGYKGSWRRGNTDRSKPCPKPSVLPKKGNNNNVSQNAGSGKRIANKSSAGRPTPRNILPNRSYKLAPVSQIICDYCHKVGHIRNRCFRLHGRPPRTRPESYGVN